MEFFIIKCLCLWIHILGESDWCEVTHSRLIFVCKFQDFCTEIGTLDHTQILLITLLVTGVFVKHVWCTSLGLRLENSFPHIGSWHRRSRPTFFLVLCVEGFKLLTHGIGETGCLVWTKERPIATLLNSLHEEIWNPESGEEIAAPRLLVTLVETQLKELHDIRVPWLEIDCDRSLSTPSLIYIARCGVKYAKHWNNTIWLTICPPNTRFVGSHIMDVHPNTPSPLWDLRTLRKSSIDTVDWVLLVGDKEATGHLGSWCTSIEEGWCCVNEHTLGHLVVCLQDRINVFPVDADCDPHEHVLWGFHEDAIEPLKIALLKGFETKVTKIIVPLRINIVPDTTSDACNFLGHNTSFGQLLHSDVEIVGADLLDVTGSYTSCESFIIGVWCNHPNAYFGRESINLLNGNTIVKGWCNLLGNLGRVAIFWESIR